MISYIFVVSYANLGIGETNWIKNIIEFIRKPELFFL